MLSHYLFLLIRNVPGYRLMRLLRAYLRGLHDYIHDFRRFTRYSSALAGPDSHPSRLARVTKAYHMIEKGLALPSPRPGFGRGYPQEPIGYLLREVPLLEAEGQRGVETCGARASIAAYVRWHDEHGHLVDPSLRTFAESALAQNGGTFSVDRVTLLEGSRVDFSGLVRTRHSIRNFTGEPVGIDAIRSAVAVALKSPRVCNRESRRVHVALAPTARERMLGLQNGNRGFGHLAGAVLMVTADLRQFVDFGERNQGWIDAGLFAMTLTYALHAQGLGTCMLNASNRASHDRLVHEQLRIGDHEVVVMFIAVGQLPATLSVAASPGPSVDDVLFIAE